MDEFSHGTSQAQRNLSILIYPINNPSGGNVSLKGNCQQGWCPVNLFAGRFPGFAALSHKILANISSRVPGEKYGRGS